MKKLLFFLIVSFVFVHLSYGAPGSNMSITPSASSGTTITASDENSRNNTISTTFNAHTHTDITQVGTISSGTWQGTAVGTSYGGLGASVPGARVFNSANISISNDTNTALTFDTERFDNDTNHSTASNTGRLTATTAGKYLIIGHAEFAANGTGRRGLSIRLNGAAGQQSNAGEHTNSGTVTTLLETQAIWNMAATDYVELMAYQNSTGSLNVVFTENSSPEFEMIYLGK